MKKISRTWWKCYEFKVVQGTQETYYRKYENACRAARYYRDKNHEHAVVVACMWFGDLPLRSYIPQAKYVEL